MFARLRTSSQSFDYIVLELDDEKMRVMEITIGPRPRANQAPIGVKSVKTFVQEGLDTADIDSELMIPIIEPIAQAENESRSENIKWGYKRHADQGISKLYNRKCYGYENDEDGLIVIKDEETKNVRFIFELYLRGFSIIGISEN